MQAITIILSVHDTIVIVDIILYERTIEKLCAVSIQSQYVELARF